MSSGPLSKDPATGLTARQGRFVDEYLVSLNARDAAVKAGYSASSAHVRGYEMLKNPVIAAAITAKKKETADNLGLTREWVISRMKAFADADTNELVEHRRVACRHCYGIGHAYQDTPQSRKDRFAEFLIAREKGGPDVFDDSGGLGYDRTKPPHPDCPECNGQGLSDIHIKDTRKLSGGGRYLYGGIKQTKEGIEVKPRDPYSATRDIAQYLGLLKGEGVADTQVTINVTLFGKQP